MLSPALTIATGTAGKAMRCGRAIRTLRVPADRTPRQPFDQDRYFGGMSRSSLLRARRRLAALPGHQRGAVLIEAALTLPILVLILLGILSYGMWIMAAHTVQQAANEAARAAMAGVDDSERSTIASQAVSRSVGSAGVVDPGLVVTSTATSGGYVTVTVTYNAPRSALFSTSLVPLPRGPIKRASVVKLAAM